MTFAQLWVLKMKKVSPELSWCEKCYKAGNNELKNRHRQLLMMVGSQTHIQLTTKLTIFQKQHRKQDCRGGCPTVPCSGEAALWVLCIEVAWSCVRTGLDRVLSVVKGLTILLWLINIPGSLYKRCRHGLMVDLAVLCWWLDSMNLKLFSNLNDFMIPQLSVMYTSSKNSPLMFTVGTGSLLQMLAIKQ